MALALCSVPDSLSIQPGEAKNIQNILAETLLGLSASSRSLYHHNGALCYGSRRWQEPSTSTNEHCDPTRERDDAMCLENGERDHNCCACLGTGSADPTRMRPRAG